MSATDERILYGLQPDGTIRAFKRATAEEIPVPAHLADGLKRQHFGIEPIERVDWSKAPHLPGFTVKPGFGPDRGYFFAYDPATKVVRAFFGGAEVGMSPAYADKISRVIFGVRRIRNPRITPRRRRST